MKGDLTNGQLVRDVDAVVHLAAAVGVGQSMYQISKYVSSNTLGTAHLLEDIVNRDNGVRKIVAASRFARKT